ncbi:ankyrin repeat domain-containing protein [Glacieibacterium megasporae]|uniref:ankyrin repeat domain-containing protein n=1 Tax=Glacieibacterium megasporae TaxID=2835787 RepID=UPI001C1DFF1B|nr:ankyrin repeat domain-containing protein [Polymorphobacter megasporae]UAJ10407.1 ankyrin repeat domain-containing protein [Polymorphobacter megasporae]
MGAKLLALIDRLRNAPWVVIALLLASTVGALAQFTGATKTLVALLHPPKPDPRAELAKLNIAFTPEAMAKAATDGDARAVGLLLDAGMAVDAAPDPAQPPLMLAAQSGSVATVARLLAAGADPARNGAAGTALDFAVRYQHPEVVKLLIAKPLPPAVVFEAFVNAGYSGDVAAIRLLAPRLADKKAAATAALQALVVDTRDGPRAAPTVAALAALKPDLNAIDANGLSPLHRAVDADAITVLTALLKAGANPNVRAFCQYEANPVTATPLGCAATRGSSEGRASALALIAAHADIEARGPGGKTPLILAADNSDAAMTIVLLDAGADPRATDDKRRTALDYLRADKFHDLSDAIGALNRALAQRRL